MLSHMSWALKGGSRVDDVFGESHVGDAALLERDRVLAEMLEHFGDGWEPARKRDSD